MSLWWLGVYFTATVSDFRSSAMSLLLLVFAALKIVRSLVSQVEVRDCVCFACSFSWQIPVVFIISTKAEYHKRQLNQALSILCLTLVFF